MQVSLVSKPATVTQVGHRAMCIEQILNACVSSTARHAEVVHLLHFCADDHFHNKTATICCAYHVKILWQGCPSMPLKAIR